MVADLRYFNSLKHEVDTLKSQLETQKIIDRLSREYYYADHMNAILGVYTHLDEVTNLQCDYLETLEKCKHLEKELSKSRTMSKSFEALQKHAINLEIDLQYELKKLIEKMKGKSVETKFEKSSVIRQPNAFKSQRQSILGMYKVHIKPNQTRTPRLPQDIRKTNKRVSFSTGVIPTTSVSRPQLKSNQLEDRVMPNNSQRKKQNVVDHHRNFKFSNNKTSITACNDSLNVKTSNVNFVCVTCGKCMLNENHDLCVLHYINGVNSRTRQPIAVPISTREPKHNVNQSVATSSKKPVATDSTIKKSRNITRKLYEQHVEIILFIVDSGCSKHMTSNLKLLTNFVEKFLGTVKFRNDQIAPILSYGDLVQGTITIKRVYYIEGLNHNLFLVGQFCDADLEVAFRKSTCYIRDLKGNDLLTGSRGTDLYSISLQDSTTPNPICLMAKATSSQAWLWHRRLSHLNFDTINLLSKNNIVNGLPKLKFVKDHLCSSCELGKAKRKSFHTKTTPSSKRRLQLLHMDLCGPMRVESINGKKYVLVIVDDFSRYTWTHFLRSKDETPGVLIDFLTLVQRGLHAQVTTVRTDKGTEFLNKTLHAYFAKEGIRHETSTARTPEQNGVVERRNRTLVEAARTMLSAAKVPLFFWAEAIATAFKFFHIFGSLCYIVRDGENLDKMKEKGDACIFVGYSTQSKAYRVFNKRTRMIVETIHVNFDELPQMASDHVSSDPGPQCSTTVLEQDSLSPGPQSQENVPQVAETVTTSNELELLYSPMFSELLNGTSHVVSKSSAVHAADNLDKRQQHNTTHTSTTTDVADPPPLNIQSTHQTPTQVPTVTAPENIIQAETDTKNAQFDKDEFINIFSTSVQEQGDTSSRHVDSSNMHTFYQHHPSAQQQVRPDIVHATCFCARYQAKPAEKHLTVVKRIFRYLKDSINMGLWYPKDAGFELTAFSDSDHACCLDSRKSTSGGIQFLGGDKFESSLVIQKDRTALQCISAETEYVYLSAMLPQVLLADLFNKALSEDRLMDLVGRSRYEMCVSSCTGDSCQNIRSDTQVFHSEDGAEILLEPPSKKLLKVTIDFILFRCCLPLSRSGNENIASMVNLITSMVEESYALSWSRLRKPLSRIFFELPDSTGFWTTVVCSLILVKLDFQKATFLASKIIESVVAKNEACCYGRVALTAEVANHRAVTFKSEEKNETFTVEPSFSG
ncbi:retrovirus-related pol polyprotein from transposon TNT 1-94 [Tanacetum coccineum]